MEKLNVVTIILSLTFVFPHEKEMSKTLKVQLCRKRR
jgi:hypothetical protein